VGETEGKRPLGGNQLRWKDNIKVDLEEIGYIYISINFSNPCC
jgi:hypothetical protein